MKNILIMGIGRAGKTTLSNMIKRKYNQYNLVHSDSIKWGIIRAKGKEDYYRENITEQKEWEHGEFLQRTILEFFNSCIRNDDDNFGYIVESGQLSPKLVKEMVDFDNTIVVCLGHGNSSNQDIFDLCRNNDKPEDWSYDNSDEDLMNHVNKWHETNEIAKRDCPKYGINYIDTSKDRLKSLNKILEDISEQIEK